jgi:ATP synthase protein I
MSDQEHTPSRDSVAARLAEAEARAAAERERQASRRAAGAAQGVGFRIATELLAALIVGGGLGYGLDRWLDTTPWFMVGMLVLGFAAGLMNVFRIMKGLDQAVGLGRAMREADEARRKEIEKAK